MDLPELKALAAETWERSAGCQPVQWRVPGMPWVTLWIIGEVAVCTPSLLAGTPTWVVRIMEDRMVTNATGRCPRCGNVAGVIGDPEERSLRLTHDENCQVADTSLLSPWLDEEGWFAMLGAD